MILQDAETLANLYLEQHNLLAKGWQFNFDNAKTRLGCCHYKKKLITLSANLTLKATEQEIENTILHEIAHALVYIEHSKKAYWHRIKAHGFEWKSQALAIGCNGQRCHNVEISGKYGAICSKCGFKNIRARKPDSCRIYYCDGCYRNGRVYTKINYEIMKND